MWDIDIQNHPELWHQCYKAVVDENAKAREEYKDLPLPQVAEMIKNRMIYARREAMRCYCESKGLQIHHVMANKGNPLTMPDNGIKDTTTPAAEVRANVPPT